jgi:hypothetical protein
MNQTKETKCVLLGWEGFDGSMLLSGNNPDLVTEEHRKKNQFAITKLKERQPFEIQKNIISETNSSLSEYLAEFWQLNPNLIQEGWTVKIADLRGVCTIQPQVEIINSKERTKVNDSENQVELANISIPKANVNPLSASFDQTKNSFVFSSPNPNLKLLSPINTQEGIFGFVVGVANSFMQVVKVRDRYFMRDGHHRAYGFLSNNINLVPVLYREFNSINEMGLPQGLFPAETLIGDKPPRLLDYFEEDVSGIAEFTRPTKVVVVQGLEILTIE